MTGDFTSSVWGIHDAQNSDDPRPTGCGYYRITLPFDQLKAHGWNAAYASGTPPATVSKYKLVVGERLDKPEVMGAWRRMKIRHRLVFELDDDVWNIEPTNTMAYRFYGNHSVQDTVETMCAMSDLVTASTEPLAEQIRKRSGNTKVRVIPNFIPESLLTMDRPRRENVTLGWTGGMSHSLDVAMIAQAVRQVMDRNKDLRLHIVGSDFRPTFGHVNTRITQWEPEPANFYQHLDFDIGLAPIINGAFNESKSHLKALEYGALGIPVIASDFGPYREYVIDGVTGFLVSTPKQWREKIRLLAADADLRESMGAKAREQAAQHTIEHNWHKWADAYQEVLQ
jgi:glycosyltransferase involved in cell wall biosynthesis